MSNVVCKVLNKLCARTQPNADRSSFDNGTTWASCPKSFADRPGNCPASPRGGTAFASKLLALFSQLPPGRPHLEGKSPSRSKTFPGERADRDLPRFQTRRQAVRRFRHRQRGPHARGNAKCTVNNARDYGKGNRTRIIVPGHGAHQWNMKSSSDWKFTLSFPLGAKSSAAARPPSVRAPIP